MTQRIRLSLCVCFFACVFSTIVAADPFISLIGHDDVVVGAEKGVHQTSDLGYIIAGSTVNGTDRDGWIVKLDSNQTIEWQLRVDRGEFDVFRDILETPDGFIAVGETRSTVAGNRLGWVVVVDADGNVQAEHTFSEGVIGDTVTANTLQSIIPAGDGYLAVGNTNTDFGAGGEDVWLLFLNSDGSAASSILYGGNLNDFGFAVDVSGDDFVFCGATQSFGVDFDDYWAVKVDSTGSIVWEKSFGGTSFDTCRALDATSDGGVILVGQGEFNGDGNFYVLKLDSDGEVEWHRSLGSAGYEYATAVSEVPGGGFIVVGASDDTGEAIAFRLDGDGNILWQRAYLIPSHFEFPLSGEPTTDGTDFNGFLIGGSSASSDNSALLIQTDTDGNVACSESTDYSVVTPTASFADTTATVTASEDLVDTEETPDTTATTATVTEPECDAAAVEVPVDFKPLACPNSMKKNDPGKVPVAIMGTTTLDVTHIDPTSIQLEGVSPVKWSIADVGSPFSPFTGKTNCTTDCTIGGKDLFPDLELKFLASDLLSALSPIVKNQCRVVQLTGKFKTEFGGGDIIGEDVIITLK